MVVHLMHVDECGTSCADCHHQQLQVYLAGCCKCCCWSSYAYFLSLPGLAVLLLIASGGQLVTLFSAPDYPQFMAEGEERYRNKGAVLHLRPPHYATPLVESFEAVLPRPPVSWQPTARYACCQAALSHQLPSHAVVVLRQQTHKPPLADQWHNVGNGPSLFTYVLLVSKSS